MLNGKKIVVVKPAYNAARTLEQTWRDIPRDAVDLLILADDFSRDETPALARALGIQTIVHLENRGYGAAAGCGCRRHAVPRLSVHAAPRACAGSDGSVR